MRRIFTILMLIAVATGARAGITPEQLRDMAYAGDVAGVEGAFAQAHAESLAGVKNYDNVRALTSILVTSHPDIIQFQSDWIKAYPDSPYAQTVMAFQLNKTAFNLRGEEYAYKVYSEALVLFGSMSEQAMDLAMKAFKGAPDYLPASDAALTIQMQTHRMTADQLFYATSLIMQTTPNGGTLDVALRPSHEGWGGGGMQDILRYCAAFASRITDIEGFDEDVCMAFLVQRRGLVGPEREIAMRIADETRHPALRPLIREVAFQRRNAADRRLILDYLSIERVWDWYTAKRFARSFFHDAESDEILRALERRADAAAREGLRHDPFGIGPITYLIDPTAVTVLGGTFEIDRAFSLTLAKRLTVAKPFDADVWYDAGRKSYLLHKSFLDADPYFANAIVYSGHAAGMIGEILQTKLYALRTEDHLPPPPPGFVVEPGAVPDITPIVRDATQICPMVRLSRLLIAACAHEDHYTCTDNFQMPVYATTMAEVAENGLCQSERTLPLDQLAFQPMPVDLGSIMDDMANR